MAELFVNRVFATLSAAIDSSQTSVALNPDQGIRFGTIGAGDSIRIVMLDGSLNVVEVVYVTARTADTLTVVRGQDGTVGVAHLINARVEARIGKSTMNSLSQKGSAGSNAIAETVLATSKATPVDADLLALADSAASFGLKRLTWANLKATLLAYFSTVLGTWAISTTGNAATVTTNANLTGPVTSVGNATAVADGALSIAKTSGLQVALDTKAPHASPTFTGTPAAPTAAPATNTTQLATTAFVTTADNLKANIASPTFTGTVTVPTPLVDGAAANKGYVDALKQGLDIKDSVRVASTVNIAIATALINASVIDGVTVATGDRVLLKNQTAGAENGIYVVVATGAAPRAIDADTSTKVTGGMYAFVSEGTAGLDTGFVLTTNDPITLGTTALSFTQFSGAGQIVAGAGLTKSANTLDVVGTAGRIVVNADSIDIGTDVVTLLGTQSLSNKTLVAPALGTPSALVGTNITGTAAGLSIGGNAGTVTNGVYHGNNVNGDFNLLLTNGHYRYNDLAPNAPVGSGHSNINVLRGGNTDTIGQLVIDYSTGKIASRGGYGIGGTPVWSAWNYTSGNNTGDQTNISGNAGTATTLQTPRLISGTSFNGSANITLTGIPTFDAATTQTYNPIPQSTDLNLCIHAGDYNFDSTATNRPAGLSGWGYLHVFRHFNAISGNVYVHQTAYDMHGETNVGAMYTRRGLPSTGFTAVWSAWTRVVTEEGGNAKTATTATSLSTVVGSAPSYACRAWVNFNGTLAAANMIRASGNVSSITDNGLGDYTVNFTTAMVDENYCVSSSAGPSGTGTSSYISALTPTGVGAGFAPTTTAIRLHSVALGQNSGADALYAYVAIFR